MTTPQDDTSDSSKPKYLTKKVVLNGQTVTLYSVNGATWLSSPDQLPDVMSRLENTRILLTDPKAAAEQGITPAQPPKTTGARYRMKGPKPRPILQPDGSLLPPTERLPAPATETEVKLSATNVEVLDDSPAARIRQLRAPREEARKNAVKAEKEAKLAAKQADKKKAAAAVVSKKAQKGSTEKRDAGKGGKPAPKAAASGKTTGSKNKVAGKTSAKAAAPKTKPAKAAAKPQPKKAGKPGKKR